MNDKNKNAIAVMVMAVGVVFVLIAGCVYATTTWNYQPESVKKLILVLCTIGLFGLERFFRIREIWPRTQLAVYDLAVAFLGFTVLAFLGGVSFPKLADADSAKLMAAFAVMAVLVGNRVRTGASSQRVFHFSVLLFLLDGILVWGFSACITLFGIEPSYFGIVLAGVLLAYSLFFMTGQEFLKSSPVMYGIYLVFFAGHAAAFLREFGGELLWVDREGLGEQIFVLALLCLAAYILWKTLEQAGTSGHMDTFFRCLHSIFLMWGIYAVSYLAACQMISQGADGDADANIWRLACLLAYLVNVGLMLCLLRREMIFLLLRIAPLLTAFQWLGAAVVYGEANRPEYYPLSLVCMAALFLLPWAAQRKGIEMPKKPYYIAGILQAVSWIVFLAGKTVMEAEGYFDYLILCVFCVLYTIYFVNRALLSKWETWGKILLTISLLPGIGIFRFLPWFEVPDQFRIEYICTLAGAAVYLYGKIWCGNSEDAEEEGLCAVADSGDTGRTLVRLVQFVLSCCLLSVLLLWNMRGGKAENALLLGGASMLMICIAGYLKRRNYMLAGVVVLFLLVVYVTRTLWLNIAWWAYLLAAGIILIVLASRALNK